MSLLSKYLDPLYNGLLEKHGVFFAFSDSQYEEQAKKGVEYVRLEFGAFAPKANAKKFIDESVEAHEEAIKEMKKHNTKDEIILSELFNYECFYTGDYSQVIDIVGNYGFNADDVYNVYRDNL